MFLVDTKDFRKFSDYPIPVSEEALYEALVEAGVTFDLPLGVKVRYKDLDPRFVLFRAEPVGGSVEEMRINLYFPPFLPGPDHVLKVNGLARHQFKHVAQHRAYYLIHGVTAGHKDGPVFTKEEAEACEVEANMHALTGECEILKEFAVAT